MDPVKTPEEAVLALGDEALIQQHRDVEAALNDLLALIARFNEKAAGWDSALELDRRRFLKELPQAVSRGDGLGRSIGRRSAIPPEQIQRAREAWLEARDKVSGLS